MSKSHTFRNVFLALCAFGILAVIAIVAFVGTAANEVSKEMDKQQNAHAITKKQFKSLDLGTKKKVIVNRFGKPEDKQSMEQADLNGGSIKSSCIYYNQKGGEFMETYQLCFNGKNKLDSKNKF